MKTGLTGKDEDAQKPQAVLADPGGLLHRLLVLVHINEQVSVLVGLLIKKGALESVQKKCIASLKDMELSLTLCAGLAAAAGAGAAAAGAGVGAGAAGLALGGDHITLPL